MHHLIGIAIYDNVQPMDVIGPWEVLSFWKNALQAPVSMFLISENGSYVQCANDIVIKAHLDFEKAPQLDYLIVPGGQGRLAQVHNEKYLSFIKKQAKSAKYILSICTGMFLLHKAGILAHKSTTTYWRALPELKSFPDVHLVEQRIVKDGNIWSSGGISSGIDLAFELIAEVAGKEVAGEVQLLFEYFPRDKVFASLNSVDQLPPYYADQVKPDLPQYIKDYIQSKRNSLGG
jgi:transcriptional regulator GlxA family with amidase domain